MSKKTPKNEQFYQLSESRDLVEYRHYIHHQGVHGIILPSVDREGLTVLNPILPSK